MLDYTLSTSEERIKAVEQLLKETPDKKLTPAYLNYMSDYILFTNDKKQTIKEKTEKHPIITKNREATINKRQVSYEQIVSTLENGEDGIYNLMRQDKNQLLDPKSPISQKDIDEIPGLKEQYKLIERFKERLKNTTAKNKRFAIKKQIIETWQQMYLMKASFRGINGKSTINNQARNIVHANLAENIYLDENQMPISDGLVNLFNPEHVSFLLCNYSFLKQESQDDLNCDMHFILMDLDNLIDECLSDKPIMMDLIIWKIDGCTNEEIIKNMWDKHQEEHSEQYYSTMWRQRIPKIIVDQAIKNYLNWHFLNIEKGYWKRCSKCGEIKLGHPIYFSRNTTLDGFYSQCKDCKNKKHKENQAKKKQSQVK